jgi:hypothetical protein
LYPEDIVESGDPPGNQPDGHDKRLTSAASDQASSSHDPWFSRLIWCSSVAIFNCQSGPSAIKSQKSKFVLHRGYFHQIVIPTHLSNPYYEVVWRADCAWNVLWWYNLVLELGLFVARIGPFSLRYLRILGIVLNLLRILTTFVVLPIFIWPSLDLNLKPSLLVLICHWALRGGFLNYDNHSQSV